MNRCGAGEGHLVIFDKTKVKLWDKKIFERREIIKVKKYGCGGCESIFPLGKREISVYSH